VVAASLPRGHADVGQLAEAFLDYALLGRLGERTGPRTWRLPQGYAALAAGGRSAAIAFAPSGFAAHDLAAQAAAAAAGTRDRRHS
jgi:hypothetical protein